MYTLRDAQIAYDNQQPEEYPDPEYTGDIIIAFDDCAGIVLTYGFGNIINVMEVDTDNLVVYDGALDGWQHQDMVALLEQSEELAEQEWFKTN